MKIRNDQLQALQQQSEVQAKQKTGGTGFTDLLAGEFGAAQSTEAGAVSAGSAFSPTMGSSASLAIAADALGTGEESESTGLEQVSQSIDSLLGGMDAYAASLKAKGGADLRGAYAQLQNMDRDLKALRAAAPDLGKRHAGLAAMVNELEVMTTTETFKFNRGDYL